jgi:hypothetical protein
MVRRNWQMRVEVTEARREATKQRKKRRESRGTHKAMVLDLFLMLDQYELRASTCSPRVFHVWTDSAPSDSPPLLDILDDGKQRGRSGSFNHTEKKGRGRANSTHEEKKKAHPRSKEAASDVAEETANVPRSCRKHFYVGKCDDIGKKGGCRHVHMPARYKTLAQVVTKEVLSLSEEATVDDGDNPDGMDMIYYLSIGADHTATPSDGSSNTSDVVAKKLADKSCAIASVVYLAINNHLIFDRYRGGIVLSDTELQSVMQGDERRLRSTSVISEGENDNEDAPQDEHDEIVLPSHVLEYILRFLPDAAVASMSRVCTSWHHEIGQHSPELWRHMLERRQWPMPAEIIAGESPRDAFQKRFLRHFAVVRDIDAIRLATGTLTNPSRKIVEEKEMVYQLFSARRLAPQKPNGCIAVRSWSAGQVLMAYSRDCTLRLFKAVDKSADGSSPRACRELVCVSVDPHKMTRRRFCRLVAMDLDEDFIGCLCHVLGDRHEDEKEESILTLTSRDDFLCSDGSGTNDPGGSTLEEGALHVINIGEAVVNYLLTHDEADHRLLRLYDFLNDGGDVSEVEVLVSQSIKACGYGRFLVEVAISIPSLEFDQEDNVMILLDRKAVLFSASAGAIVWMGYSNPTDTLVPRHEDMTMVSFRQCRPGERRTACSLAFVSSSSEMILSAELDSAGEMQCPTLVEACAIVRNEVLENSWQMHRIHRRPVAITSSDIVVADTLFRELDGGKKVKKSVVSFYPRFAPEISYATLALEGDCEAIRMECLHDDYAVVLCRVRESHNPEAAVGDIESDNTASLSIDAIVIHVPSRRVIHRVCMLDEDSAFTSEFAYPISAETYDCPIFFTSNGDTVGVGLWWKGVILTGKDVREAGNSTMHAVEEEPSRSARKQKKKKRQTVKGGKKDGFARGQSLRG